MRRAGVKGVTYDNQLGMLRLEAAVVKGLFRYATESITEQIGQALAKSRDLLGDESRIRYLFLTGSFAESRFVQTAVREEFSGELEVIIPQGMSLAILRGAALSQTSESNKAAKGESSSIVIKDQTQTDLYR